MRKRREAEVWMRRKETQKEEERRREGREKEKKGVNNITTSLPLVSE